MNAYLTSPVTLIVLAVVAVAALIAIVLTVRSHHRKEREWQEERDAMEKRVAKRIADEREGRDRPPRRAKPLPVGRRTVPDSVQRATPTSRSRDANDDLGLFIPAVIASDMMHSDPSPSYCAPSSSSSDSGSSSSSSDSGSSSSSSDSGSSGGGGGCD